MIGPIDLNALVGDLPVLVPAKDAADRLGVTVRTLRRWIASERLNALKTSPGRPGRVLVPRSEILRLLGEMAS